MSFHAFACPIRIRLNDNKAGYAYPPAPFLFDFPRVSTNNRS
jgi:hypothetical protein